MNDILIFDDIVPLQHQEFLEYYFLRGDNKWYFQRDITYDKSQEEKKIVNHYGFANLIYDVQSKNEIGTDFYNVLPVLYQALHKSGMSLETVLRMRSFLQLPVAGSEHDPLNNPHVDLPISHMVLLYYLTDADGDTYIYNESNKSDSYTIKQQVTPKRGRCVLFNGTLYHSSSRPTNNRRCVLNINFITK
jgi:hypothetical protein